jgi:hypothetical protein
MSADQVSPNHITCRTGERILKGLLEDKGWIVRREETDYGLDFNISLVENGTDTNQRVYIQLKSSKSLSNSKAKFGFEKRKLKEYSAISQLPVFIFLIDVKRERAFYIFAQEWADTHTSELASTKEKIQITFPQDHQFTNQNIFHSFVKNAWDYMKRRHPGPVDAALSHHINDINKANPGWKISAHTCYSAIPDENVPIELQLKVLGEKALTGMQELWDYGSPTELIDQEFSIHGLPEIFDCSALHQKLQLRSANEKDANIVISCSDLPGKVLQLQCKFRQGSRGFTLESTITGSPIYFSGRYNINRNETNINVKVQQSSKCSLSKWYGKDARALPYYDDFESYYSIISSKHEIKVTVNVDGNYLFSYKLSQGAEKSQFSFACYVLRAFVFLSRKCVHKIALPDIKSLSKEQIQEIIKKYKLFNGVDYIETVSEEFTICLPQTNDITENEETEMTFVSYYPSETYQFYGNTIQLPFVLAIIKNLLQIKHNATTGCIEVQIPQGSKIRYHAATPEEIKHMEETDPEHPSLPPSI